MYIENRQLQDGLRRRTLEAEKYHEIAEYVKPESWSYYRNARSTWDKLRKERDQHKLHHRRVVRVHWILYDMQLQEKERIVVELKRLRNHAESFQPALEQMKKKYEAAMKEKMLIKLDRDKLATKVMCCECLCMIQSSRALRCN